MSPTTGDTPMGAPDLNGGQRRKRSRSFDPLMPEFTQPCEFGGIPVLEVPRDFATDVHAVPSYERCLSQSLRTPSCRTSLQKASIAAI